MAALGVMAVLSAVSVVLELNYANAIDDLFNGNGGFEDALGAEDARGAVGAVFLGGIIITAILWVLWVQRSRTNAIALGAGGQRYSDGLAVGGWFIPLANIVIGRTVINDLWRATDPTIPSGYWVAGRPVAGIVNGWFALWMIAWPLSRALIISADGALDDFEIESAVQSYEINAFITAGFIIAAILALQIVKQVTDRQRQRAALFGIVLD